MKRRLWSARLVLGTLVAGALLATHVPASKAECVWGVLYVTRKNASSIPVWGPGCLTDGPFPQNLLLTDDHAEQAVPDGTPNGYFVDVLMTVP